MKKFLFIVVLMILFPLNTKASSNPVYWDEKIGGDGYWYYDVFINTFSLREYVGSTSTVTIKKIVFNDTSSTNIVIEGSGKDISRDKDRSVLAIIKDDVLYIQYSGTLYFNSDSSYLFEKFYYVTTIEGLEYVNTSNVINMDNMFEECNSITSLDLSSFNTSNVTSMSGMFSNCYDLQSINFNNWNTSNVVNMDNMFEDCNSLISLDLSSFDTSNVKYMYYMFNGCGNLINLDLSNFNTSNVKYMYYMFNGCGNLTNLDLSNFNTSNVVNMSYMFLGCGNLTNLDLSNFNTSNVVNMSYMFAGCGSLTNLDLSNFDTSNVLYMESMFLGCSSLTSLDLSSFNTEKVEKISDIFKNATSLEKIYVSDLWKLENVYYTSELFLNNNNLVGQNGTVYDENENGLRYANIDGLDKKGYLSTKVDIKSSTHDINKKYVYSGLKELDVKKISLTDGEAKIENNQLNIYYGGVVLKRLDLIHVSSKVYDINKDYVYVGANEINKDNIIATNAKKVVNGDKLDIYYEEELIDSYNIISIKSEIYGMHDECVYVRISKPDPSKITVINGTIKLDDNKFKIYYGDDLLKSLDIISISSDEYDLYDDYGYIGEEELDISKIKVSKGHIEHNGYEVYDNYIQIMYNNICLENYEIRSAIRSVGITRENLEIDIRIYGGYGITAETYSWNTPDDKTLTWSSSNTKVATIDPETGIIKPISPGKTIITVTTKNQKTDSIEVIICGGLIDADSIMNITNYDGKYHTIDLKINTPNSKVLYSTDGINYNLKELPKYKIPGGYKIYYKITADYYEDYYGFDTVDIRGITGMKNFLNVKENNLIINNYDNSLYNLINGIELHPEYDFFEYRYNGGIVNGISPSYDEIIKTGGVLDLYIGTIFDKVYSYNLVLRGDLSGDGDVDSLDLATMLNHISEKKELKNSYLESAYLNNDEDIDSLDLAYLMNHIAGKEGY